MKKELNNLGKRIKKLREEKGLSIRELARKSNLSPASIIEIEKGERNFRFTTLYEISNGLSLELDELIDDAA